MQHSKEVFGNAEAERMVSLNFNVKKALFDADGISSFAQVPDDGMVSGAFASLCVCEIKSIRLFPQQRARRAHFGAY